MSDEILKESDSFISTQKSKPLSENKSFSKVTDEGDLARRHENMVNVHKSLIVNKTLNSKKSDSVVKNATEKAIDIATDTIEKAAKTVEVAASAISSSVSGTSTGSELPSGSEPVSDGGSNSPIETNSKPSYELKFSKHNNGKAAKLIKTYHISKRIVSKKNKLSDKKTSSSHLSRITKTASGAAKNIMITTPSNIIRDQTSVTAERIASEDEYMATALAGVRYSQLTVGGTRKAVNITKNSLKTTAKITKQTAKATKETAKATAQATKATVKIGVKTTKVIGSAIAKVSVAIVNAVSAAMSAIASAIAPFLPIICIVITIIGALAAVIGVFVWLFSSETTDNDISQTYAYVTQLDADLTKRIYNTKSGIESFISGVTVEYRINGVKTYSLDEYNTQFFTDVETVIALLEVLYDDWGFLGKYHTVNTTSGPVTEEIQPSSQKFVDALHGELYQYNTYVSDESTDDKKIVVIEVTTKTFAEYINENQSGFQTLFNRLDVDMTVDEFLEVYTNEVGVFTIRNDMNNPLGEHKSTVKTRYGYFFDYEKVFDGGVHQISAHAGVDVFAKKDQDVLAGVNGTVIDRFTDPDMGGVVIIQLNKTDDDDRERVILYAHLSAFWVDVGDKVDKSSKVGIVANNRVSKNGCGHGSFVHIEYSIDDTLMCPSIYISGLQQDLKQ